MKRILLFLTLTACGRNSQQEKHTELNLRIEETWRRIEATQREIDALVKGSNIDKMIDCVNGALNTVGLDRDQFLTIEGCMQEAGYRE